MSDNRTMSNAERVVSYFEEGYTCCQSIILVYADQLGLSREIVMRIGTVFGGGMACTGETCGVVIGSLIVIALHYGQTELGDERAREMTYYFAGEFIDLFRSSNGSIACKELLGCDLSTPEGRKHETEKSLAKSTCPKFLLDAVVIIEEIFNY